MRTIIRLITILIQYFIIVSQLFYLYESYPFEGNIEEQYLWLDSHASKLKDIIYLKSLLHAGYNETFMNEIYFKDATSSGLQIIAMLTRNLDLARRTNLFGLNIEELHTYILNLFLKDVTKLKDTYSRMMQLFHDKEEQLKEFENFCSCDQVSQKIFNPEYNSFLGKIKENIALKESIVSFKITMKLHGLKQLFPEYLTTTDVLKKSLMYFFYLYQLYHAYESLPPSFFTRKVFKDMGMKAAYGQGVAARINEIKAKIIEFYSDNGYSQILISPKNSHLIGINSAHFFKTFSYDIYKPVHQYIESLTEHYKHDEKIT